MGKEERKIKAVVVKTGTKEQWRSPMIIQGSFANGVFSILFSYFKSAIRFNKTPNVQSVVKLIKFKSK